MEDCVSWRIFLREKINFSFTCWRKIIMEKIYYVEKYRKYDLLSDYVCASMDLNWYF